MKRILSIFLFSLYTLSSLGLVIQAHYCGEALAAIQLFDKASCCCDETSVPLKKDCCKDEVKTLNIKEAQIKSEQDLTWGNFTKIISPKSPSSVFNVAHTYSSCQSPRPLPDPPEVVNAIPLYTKFHSLLFYS